jgi:hypothetical protein
MSKPIAKVYKMYNRAILEYLYGAAWGFNVLWVLELEVRAAENDKRRKK